MVNNMEKLEKTIKYTKLYSLYKTQLSNSQKEIINDYYLLDLSLAEIASNRDVSRSAVEDALKKAMNKLDEMERDFGLLKKEENILKKLEGLKNKSLNMSEVLEIEEIEKDIKYGI